MAFYKGSTMIAGLGGGSGTGEISALSAQLSAHDADVKGQLSAHDQGVLDVLAAMSEKLNQVNQTTGNQNCLDYGAKLKFTVGQKTDLKVSADVVPYDCAVFWEISSRWTDLSAVSAYVDDTFIEEYEITPHDGDKYPFVLAKADVAAGTAFKFTQLSTSTSTAAVGRLPNLTVIPYRYGKKIQNPSVLSTSSFEDVFQSGALEDFIEPIKCVALSGSSSPSYIISHNLPTVEIWNGQTGDWDTDVRYGRSGIGSDYTYMDMVFKAKDNLLVKFEPNGYDRMAQYGWNSSYHVFKYAVGLTDQTAVTQIDIGSSVIVAAGMYFRLMFTSTNPGSKQSTPNQIYNTLFCQKSPFVQY